MIFSTFFLELFSSSCLFFGVIFSPGVTRESGVRSGRKGKEREREREWEKNLFFSVVPKISVLFYNGCLLAVVVVFLKSGYQF